MIDDAKLLIGKKPNYVAGEGYLYQFINLDTGEITEEDEFQNIINHRKADLIRKGMKTEFGTVVTKAGGKVYFDTRKYASTATLNRYVLQKGIFPKFPSFKTPKVPKIETVQPSETTQTAQDGQTTAETTKDPSTTETTPQTAPTQPKTPEAPKQPKYAPGQERPGHKYVKRMPDPKRPGKYIYLYQEDLDAENRKQVYVDDEGKTVKPPEYGNKYHEQRYQGEEWKPVKKVGLVSKMLGDRTEFVNELADGVTLHAPHSDRGYSNLWLESKRSGEKANITDGEDMHEYVQDQLAKKEYVASTDDEIQVGEDASYTDDGEGGNTKTTHGIVVYNPSTKKYRYIEGNTEVAYDDYHANREGSNPAAQWLLNAWKRHNRDKAKWENGQTTEQPAKVEEQPEQTPSIDSNEGQGEANYELGKEYTVNGFTGSLTAKQGKVGILKDRDGNLKLFKLEHFEVTPYAEPEGGETKEKTDPEQMPEFKTYKEYQQYADTKRRLRNEQLLSRFKAGGFKTKKTAAQLAEEEQAAAERERIKQESLERNREILDSDEYKTGREEIEAQGFKVGNNEFFATKEIPVRNFNFAMSAEFSPSENKWKTRFHNAPYTTVQVGDETYSIDDMNEEGVFYRAVEIPDSQMDIFGSDEENQNTEPVVTKKFISYDELEEMNGKRIFEKTPDSKGLVSSRDAEPVFFPNRQEEMATWEVVELSDVIISNLQNGSINPRYSNKKMQARDRSDEETQNQITDYATNMDFRKFSPACSLWGTDGATVVDQNYEAISGNGRAMAVERHYLGGRTEYKEELIKNATKLGFDPAEIEKMNQPIVVRRLNVNTDRATDLGILGNKDTKKSQSNTEKAVAYATLIKPEAAKQIAGAFNTTMEKLKAKHLEKGKSEEEFSPTMSEILDKAGFEIFQILQRHGVIQNEETADFYNTKIKAMSPDNKKKVTEMLTQYVLGKAASTDWDRAFDKTREAIQQSLGAVLQFKNTEMDISPELTEVIKLQSVLRQRNDAREDEGKPLLTPENLLLELQNPMFGEAEITPSVEKMFLAMHYSTQSQTRKMIERYKQGVEGDSFTEGSKDKDRLIGDVFQAANGKGVSSTPKQLQPQQPKPETKQPEASPVPEEPKQEDQQPEASPTEAPQQEEPKAEVKQKAVKEAAEPEDYNSMPYEDYKKRVLETEVKPSNKPITQELKPHMEKFLKEMVDFHSRREDFDGELRDMFESKYSNYHRSRQKMLTDEGKDWIRSISGKDYSDEELSTISAQNLFGSKLTEMLWPKKKPQTGQNN